LYETNPTDEATHSERHFFVSRSIGFCTSKNEPTSVQIFFFRKKNNTNKQTKIQRQNQNTSMHDILNPFPIFLVCFLKMVVKKRINLPKTKHHHNKF